MILQNVYTPVYEKLSIGDCIQQRFLSRAEIFLPVNKETSCIATVLIDFDWNVKADLF